MKRSVILLFCLIIAIISLLFYQWTVYKDQKLPFQSTERDQKFSMEILASHEGDRLEIKQKINNVKKGIYRLERPEGAMNMSCESLYKSEECSINNNELTVMDDMESFVFTFSILIDMQDNGAMLPKWAVYFQNKDNQYLNGQIKLFLIEKNSKITWAAGAKLLLSGKKENVRYFSWEKDHDISFPLYLTKNKPTILYGIERLNKNDYLDISKLLEIQPVFSPLTLVQIDHPQKRLIEEGLVVISSSESKSEVKESLVAASIYDQITLINRNNKWLAPIFTSSLLHIEPPTEKEKKMVEDLSEVLQYKEKQAFFDWLYLPRSIQLEAKDFDEELGEIIGKKTQFFSSNYKSKAFVPLYFIDDRLIEIDGKLLNGEMVSIIQNRELYLPLTKIVENLGYDVTALSNNQTILLEYNGNNWRIFLNEKFFIYNEEEYGLTKEPIQLINGIPYMSKQWFEEFLHFDIVEGDHYIKVSTN